MSYILDALKKSEQQRSSVNVPIKTPPLTPQPVSGTSPFTLPLILLAAALAGGWFFVHFQQPLNPPLPPAKIPITDPAHREAQTSSIQTQDYNLVIPLSKTEPAIPAIRPHQQSIIATATRIDHQAPSPRNKPDIIPIFKPITPASPVSRADSQQIELPDKIAQPSPAEANIPSRRELPVSVQQSLPPINIEGHIYDANPVARMVIINGAIRREKQRIDHGMILEEITPNGVILSYQGHVFHMGVFEQ